MPPGYDQGSHRQRSVQPDFPHAGCGFGAGHNGFPCHYRDRV